MNLTEYVWILLFSVVLRALLRIQKCYIVRQAKRYRAIKEIDVTFNKQLSKLRRVLPYNFLTTWLVSWTIGSDEVYAR
jgi:hypothetical protein